MKSFSYNNQAMLAIVVIQQPSNDSLEIPVLFSVPPSWISLEIASSFKEIISQQLSNIKTEEKLELVFLPG